MISKRSVLGGGAVAIALATAWIVYAAQTAGPAGAAAGSESSASARADEILARVGDRALTRAEVDRRIDAMLAGQLAMIPPEQRDGVRAQVRERVLDEMVVQTLLGQAAEKRRISVSEDEVDGSLRELVSSLPPGSEMSEIVAAAGMTEQELKKQLSESLRIRKLLEQETAAAGKPSDAEIRAFYEGNQELFVRPERVRARHVLIATTPADDAQVRAEKRAKAQAVRERLVSDAGRSFAEVAAETSDCPSKAQGGDLGTIARGQTVPAFEEAVFAQKVGEIGPVVETDFGFHVIQVQEREEAGKVPLAEAKAMIAEQLAGEKKQAAVDTFIERLRAGASVVYPTKDAA